MAAGKRKPLTIRERRTLEGAVKTAEDMTGLQFCVYLGPGVGDERKHAEQAFVDAGLHDRPAVLIAVAADHRRVDVVTAPSVRERVTDGDCERAVLAMTPKFAEHRFVDGLVAGIAMLADAAGPGQSPGGSELPDVIE